MLRFGLAAIAALLIGGFAVLSANRAEGTRVRVLHASPDAPPVDIYANGSPVLTGVSFNAASDYLEVPAGAYRFEVRPAGAETASSPVLTADVDLKAGTDYTVAAVDRVSQIDARLFIDDNAAPASGKAHVQIIHASPDAPAVDIGLKGGTVLVPSLPFGELKGPLPVDAGTYDLEVRVAGTDTVVLPLDDVRLDAGNIYTFAAVGLVDEDPALSVLPLVFTPNANVSAPSAGDGGLLAGASDDGGNSYLPWLAAAALAAIGVVFAARLVLVRARK